MGRGSHISLYGITSCYGTMSKMAPYSLWALVKNSALWASRVAQWLRALYCSASCAIRVLGSRPGSIVTGRAREVRGATHNWPSVARVREGLVGRGVLVSSRTSESCGGLGAVVHGVRCFLWRIGAAGFRVGCALC